MALEEVVADRRLLPIDTHVEQVDEVVVGERSGVICENAKLGQRTAAGIRPQHPQATNEHGHLRGRKRQQLRPIDEQFLGRPVDLLGEMIAKPVRLRLQHGERIDIGHCLRRIGSAGREGHRQLLTDLPGGLLHRSAAAEHDQIGHRHLPAPGLGGVELLLDRRQPVEHLRQLGGLVDLPVLLGRQSNSTAVGTPALVAASKCRSRGPGRRDKLRDGETGAENLHLQGGDVRLVDGRILGRRHGILPDLRRGHVGPQQPRHRSHVAVGELVPSLGKRFPELLGVLVKPLRNRPILRIHAERKIGGEHHRRVGFGDVVGVWNRALGRLLLRRPLPGPGRTLRQFPLIAEKMLEVVVRPVRRR